MEREWDIEVGRLAAPRYLVAELWPTDDCRRRCCNTLVKSLPGGSGGSDWGGPGLTDGLELGIFRCLDFLLFGFAVYLHPQRGLTRMRQKVAS